MGYRGKWYLWLQGEVVVGVCLRDCRRVKAVNTFHPIGMCRRVKINYVAHGRRITLRREYEVGVCSCPNCIQPLTPTPSVLVGI
jgi:hypothetical protein